MDGGKNWQHCAREQLYLTLQSMSGQLGELESNLGVQLLKKAGRGLELTKMGRKVFSYADDIFALGGELLEITQNQLRKKKYSVSGGNYRFCC